MPEIRYAFSSQKERDHVCVSYLSYSHAVAHFEGRRPKHLTMIVTDLKLRTSYCASHSCCLSPRLFCNHLRGRQEGDLANSYDADLSNMHVVKAFCTTS